MREYPQGMTGKGFNVKKTSIDNKPTLSVGMYEGVLTLFDQSGNHISGIRSTEICSSFDSLVTVKCEILVGKDFFIFDGEAD